MRGRCLFFAHGLGLIVAIAMTLAVSTPAAAQQDAAIPGPTEAVAEGGEAVPAAAPTPQVPAAPIVIPVPDIPFRSEQSTQAVRRVTALSAPSDAIQAIETAIVDQEVPLRQLRLNLDAIDTRRTSVQLLDDQRVAWLELQQRLSSWNATLQSRWSTLVAGRDELRRDWERWDATYRDIALNTDEPVELLLRVGEILDALDGGIGAAQQRADDVGASIVRTNDALAVATDAVDRLDELLVVVRQRLLTRDADPIWHGISVANVRRFPSDVDESRRLWVRTLVEFVREREGRFSLLLGVFLVLFLLALSLYRWSRHWVSDESLAKARYVASRPLSLAVLFTLAASALVLPRTVGPVDQIVALVAIPPVLRVGVGIVATHIRTALYGASALLFLRLLTTFVPAGTESRRLALLVLSVLTLVGASYLLRRWRHREVTRYKTGRIGTAGLYLAAVLFTISFVANLFGWFALSEHLLEATINATYAALAWLVFFRAVVGLLPVVPRSVVGKVVPSVVTYESNFITRNTQLLAVVVFFMWLGPVLQNFQLSDLVWRRIDAALTYSIAVGGLEVSIGSLLAAITILVLTFPAAGLVRFVLSKEVLRRFPLPAGVDHTVVAIANYTVIVVGILMSAAAAGLTGTQLTVVFGALGVGIGFGLQSVVNNFVSGLILMFERPIKVGDKIEATGRLGVVTQIGMRASMIRTFEGAEVVVPNGDLISKEVVNWTLSDQKRRVDVAVQVVEETDVKRVIQVLQGAAEADPAVMTEPAPEAIMTGLGEGCLNFQLRTWTEQNPVAVSSDLHVRVNDALREAGVRTAIPQRALHLKSVAPGSALVVDGIQAPEKKHQ